MRYIYIYIVNQKSMKNQNIYILEKENLKQFTKRVNCKSTKKFILTIQIKYLDINGEIRSKYQIM
jgi:hypothetical protein